MGLWNWCHFSGLAQYQSFLLCKIICRAPGKRLDGFAYSPCTWRLPEASAFPTLFSETQVYVPSSSPRTCVRRRLLSLRISNLETPTGKFQREPNKTTFLERSLNSSGMKEWSRQSGSRNTIYFVLTRRAKLLSVQKKEPQYNLIKNWFHLPKCQGRITKQDMLKLIFLNPCKSESCTA